MRIPFRFEGFDDPEVQRPPLLGEHTDEVLRERLAMGVDEIARLRADGAI